MQDNRFIEKWFVTLCRDLRGLTAGGWLQDRSAGTLLLEVLTDSSNELFVAGFVATHLRRFGQRYFGGSSGHFWARSEWCKFDLCFGLASDVFDNWNDAWTAGITGDLGTIELKVVYAHYSPGKRKGIMSTLDRQLATRQVQVRQWHAAASAGAITDQTTYHGLVFGVTPGLPHDPPSVPALQSPGLVQIGAWQRVAHMASAELQTLWPRSDLQQGLDLCVALFRPVASDQPEDPQLVAPPDGVGDKRITSSPGARVDRATVLERSTPDAAALFTFLLDEGVRRGHHVYWGTAGFSVGAYAGGERFSFVYGFPPDDFRFYFQGGAPWAIGKDAAAFRSELLSTGIFREAGRLTLSARVDATTTARAHQVARRIFDHVEESVRQAGEL